jgi:hypothetical protein
MLKCTVTFLAFIAGLAVWLLTTASIRGGKIILTEDTKDRYVQLRTGGWGSYILSKPTYVKNRGELEQVHEVHGDLKFICSEIHGVDNPRIVIESKNQARYQVIYKYGDREALKVIAKPLGLTVTHEEREIRAITVRVSEGGHRLKPAAKGKKVKIEEVCSVEGRWPLDGVSADELARFLERRYHEPVVNLTSLKGTWSMLLSHEAGNFWPSANEKKQLDDLGLELRWEKVRIPVTVVKDKDRK